MPTRVRTMFGAYDLYAKLIPGTFFFVGLLTLLPTIPDLRGFEGPIALTVIIVLGVFVVGFAIGQVLHSVSVVIERSLYKLGRTIYLHPSARRVRAGHLTERESVLKRTADAIGKTRPRTGRFLALVTAPFRWVAFLVVTSYSWGVKQLHGLLVPHRRLFENVLIEQFHYGNEPDPIYNWFKYTCRDHLRDFQMDLPERYEDIYRFVMSSLEFKESGRARQFQAMASFARGMWVTLILFFLFYAILVRLGPTFVLGYEPLLASTLQNHSWKIPGALLAGSVFFMSSAKQYKRNFAEYIAVDFYTVAEFDNRGGGSVDWDYR